MTSLGAAARAIAMISAIAQGCFEDGSGQAFGTWTGERTRRTAVEAHDAGEVELAEE